MSDAQRPKPSQDWVEVSSDSDEPRQHGVLRGLNPHKVITVARPVDGTELIEDVDAAEKNFHPYSRRSMRNESKNSINYDMKYHPMDVVTRPNCAATRRHRSKSLTVADQGSDDDDDDDDDEPTDVGNEDSDSSEDTLSSDTPAEHVTPISRRPDRRAVRKSSRTEAKKYVNYSNKVHPQDKFLRNMSDFSAELTTKSSSRPSLQDEYQDERADSPERGRPRKKLRSLDPNIRSSKKAQSSTVCTGAKKMSLSLEYQDFNKDPDELVEDAIRASQPPKPLKKVVNPQTPQRLEIMDFESDNSTSVENADEFPRLHGLNDAEYDIINTENICSDTVSVDSGRLANNILNGVAQASDSTSSPEQAGSSQFLDHAASATTLDQTPHEHDAPAISHKPYVRSSALNPLTPSHSEAADTLQRLDTDVDHNESNNSPHTSLGDQAYDLSKRSSEFEEQYSLTDAAEEIEQRSDPMNKTTKHDHNTTSDL